MAWASEQETENPGCTVGGFAVEWIRTCFSSHFRLFAGRPDVLTRGRWVRMPRTTRHFPFLHWYGSRDWTSDERDPWPRLGEYDGPRTYYNGAPPVPLPSARLIGTLSCIRDGESYPPPPTTFLNGFDQRAYTSVAQHGLPPDALPTFNISDRAQAAAAALVISTLYTDPAAAELLALQIGGPGAVAQTVPNDATFFPGSIVVTTPTQTIVFISGTTTPQQYALQILFDVGGITDFGPFSTNFLWYNAATVIRSRMILAGVVTKGQPTTIVGHSYGGAVAAVLAARIQAGQPGTDVRLLTFGMPRPGDARLAALLKPMPSIHYANVGDPVPAVPPTGPELAWFGGAITAPFLLLWRRVDHSGNQVILSADGTAVPNNANAISLDLLWQVVLAAVNGDTLPLYAAHAASEYALRLNLTPP